MMKTLHVDLETFSSAGIAKTGVYSYCEADDFEVLLFGYSVDAGPVQVVDLANGEQLPMEIRCALPELSVTKWAFNASFERVCLSRYLACRPGNTSTRRNGAVP
jgi:DNA polymerase